MHLIANRRCVSAAAKHSRESEKRTVERLNFGEKPLPPLVLLVHAAEVGNKEGLLGVGLALRAEVESVHDPVSEMHIRVAPMEGRQARNRNFVVVMTVGVLEGIGRVVGLYDRGRGIESVYESVGKILFVVRTWEGGRKGGRTRDDVIVEVDRGMCGEDVELRHS